MVGLAVTFGLTAIFAVTHFPQDDNWSQSAIDRSFEQIHPRSRPSQRHGQHESILSIPRLIVHSSRGVAGEPAPLGLALQGPTEGAVVIITGLVPGMDCQPVTRLVAALGSCPGGISTMPGSLHPEVLSVRPISLPSCGCKMTLPLGR